MSDADHDHDPDPVPELAQVREATILAGGFPTRVLHLGRAPGELQEEQEQNQRRWRPRPVMLIIPGNPGLAGYYERFMLDLREAVTATTAAMATRTTPATPDIWAVSHVGHEAVSHGGADYFAECSLAQQVEHKIALVSEWVPPDCDLTLVAHSVGCLIAMEVADHFADLHQQQQQVRQPVRAHMLFPMMMKMRLTPNGGYAHTLTSYFTTVAKLSGWLLTQLPGFLLRRLIRWRLSGGGQRIVPECCVETTVRLLDPRAIG